jgi:hypothetical protein
MIANPGVSESGPPALGDFNYRAEKVFNRGWNIVTSEILYIPGLWTRHDIKVSVQIFRDIWCLGGSRRVFTNTYSVNWYLTHLGGNCKRLMTRIVMNLLRTALRKEVRTWGLY